MTATVGGELSLEYMTLDYLLGVLVEDNPKEHDVPGIKLSIQRRAFNAPPTVDEKSGKLVAGHGRIEALRQLRAESPGAAPRHIRVDPALGWMVPVVRGVSFDNDEEFYEYLVSDNALAIARGWDDARLGPIVKRLVAAQVPLAALGHDRAALDHLVSRLHDAEPDFTPGTADEQAGLDQRAKVTCPECGHEFPRP